MKNASLEEIWQVIDKADSILIPLHLGPDADSMASAVVMASFLRSIGKQVKVVSTDPWPPFGLLEKVFDIELSDPAQLDLSTFDLFLAQDIAALSRYSAHADFQLPDELPVINLDHHKTNTFYGDLNYVNLEVRSTAEIVFQLLQYKQALLSPDQATALFFGIMADTGWFAYEATPATCDVVKELIRLGAQSRLVSVEMRQTSVAQLQMIGRVYSRLKEEKEHGFVYSYILQKDYEELGLTGQSIVSGIDALKYLPDVNFSMIIHEKGDGLYKVSLRTREAHTFDSSRLATTIEPERGGGHAMAAGFTMNADSIVDVVTAVKKATQAYSVN